VASGAANGWSTADGPLGFYVERIDRLARRHEKAVALETAEAEVGAALRQQNAADQLAVGRKDGDAVLVLTAGKPGPDIALGIAADAVGIARRRVEGDPAVGGFGAVLDDVVDVRRLCSGAGRVDDVEPFLVG
jgi:hypothetical protein